MQTLQPNHISSPEQLRDFIDHRGEGIIREVKALAERTAKNEIKLAEFELLYASVVPKNVSGENLRLLRKDRQTRWERALKAAGGDEEKALFTYDDA